MAKNFTKSAFLTPASVVEDQKEANAIVRKQQNEVVKNEKRENTANIDNEMRKLYGPPTTKPDNCERWKKSEVKTTTVDYRPDTYKAVRKIQHFGCLSFKETQDRLLKYAIRAWEQDNGIIFEGYETDE